jgi:uncharacterized protein (UPF0212 family)
MVVSALNSAALLTAWEECATQPALRRALTLLVMARPQTSAEEWSRVSIGERDRTLLRIREELFGSKIEATAECPRCGERLELAFGTHDIWTPEPCLPTPKESLRLEAAGYEVRYRLPTTADLAEMGTMEGRNALLKRCVELARFGAQAIDPEALPDEIVTAVAAGMAEADPQAEVRIALSCPGCSNQWSSVFDIVAFLWGEIEDWAQRLLLEVHALASAYGWSERDIVAMGPRRRRFYLEMVHS